MGNHRKLKKKAPDHDFFPMFPVMEDGKMPEERKKAEALKNKIIEKTAELFKGMDEFSRFTLFCSMYILAMNKRKELDEAEKDKK